MPQGQNAIFHLKKPEEGDVSGEPIIVRKEVNVAVGKTATSIQPEFKGLTNGQRYEFCQFFYTNETDGQGNIQYYKEATRDYFTVKISSGIVELKDSRIEDGKGDDAWYDLRGHRVTNTGKGIYIYKGKKVIR